MGQPCTISLLCAIQELRRSIQATGSVAESGRIMKVTKESLSSRSEKELRSDLGCKLSDGCKRGAADSLHQLARVVLQLCKGHGSVGDVLRAESPHQTLRCCCHPFQQIFTR